jgi:hypothetical protein
VVSSLPSPVSPGARRVRQILERMLRIANSGVTREDIEAPTRLTSPTEYVSNTVEVVSLVAGLLSEVEKSGLDGRGCSRATAVRWIAAAVEAGLVARVGSTSAARYGLPPPVEKVGGVGVPIEAIAAPGVSPEPVKTSSEEIESTEVSTVVVSDGLAEDILGPRWSEDPPPAATDPPADVARRPPPDGWRSWESFFAEPCLRSDSIERDTG